MLLLLLTGTLLRCCSLLCCMCCCATAFASLPGLPEEASRRRHPVAAAGFSLFPSDFVPSFALSGTHARIRTHTNTLSLTSRPPKPTFAPTAFLQSDRDK